MDFILVLLGLIIARAFFIESWIFRVFSLITRANENLAREQSPLRISYEAIPSWWRLFSDPYMWTYKQASACLDFIKDDQFKGIP